jgi:hypothetical protein
LHPLSIRNAQRATGLEQKILADSVIFLGFRRGTEPTPRSAVFNSRQTRVVAGAGFEVAVGKLT